MKKIFALCLMALTVILLVMDIEPAYSDDNNQISSITALADSSLALPLSELASRFTHENLISVSAMFGTGAAQKKKIEDGEPADLFITSDPQMLHQLKNKGLVDVYSIHEIARAGNVHYTAAVVAGENMSSARRFMDYLNSSEAREIFRQNGFEPAEN